MQHQTSMTQFWYGLTESEAAAVLSQRLQVASEVAVLNWKSTELEAYRVRRGVPIRRLTVCFSMYSPMSMRTIIFSSSNTRAARAFASSVLPTPVGFKKRKLLPLLRAARPALVHSTASATACTFQLRNQHLHTLRMFLETVWLLRSGCEYSG